MFTEHEKTGAVLLGLNAAFDGKHLTRLLYLPATLADEVRLLLSTECSAGKAKAHAGLTRESTDVSGKPLYIPLLVDDLIWQHWFAHHIFVVVFGV